MRHKDTRSGFKLDHTDGKHTTDAAAKRIDTSLLRVPMRRRVRNTEGAVDSVAVMDWSWAIIIIVVAILAHIVSSEAVPDSH